MSLYPPSVKHQNQTDGYNYAHQGKRQLLRQRRVLADGQIKICDNVRKHNRYRIVQQMRKDGQPQRPAPYEEVAQVCAQEQSSEKAAELQVDCAENDGGNPNRRMFVVKPIPENRLQGSPEEKLLANGGENGANQDVEQ